MPLPPPTPVPVKQSRRRLKGAREGVQQGTQCSGRPRAGWGWRTLHGQVQRKSPAVKPGTGLLVPEIKRSSEPWCALRTGARISGALGGQERPAPPPLPPSSPAAPKVGSSCETWGCAQCPYCSTLGCVCPRKSPNTHTHTQLQSKHDFPPRSWA